MKRNKLSFETIDWQAQWEAHGLNFRDGYVHIDIPEAVSPAWQQLKLMPGAGFGDLSHPTTRLMLKLMNDKVSGQYVVDIGCGSGVLALCAVALGAQHVYAIDIDIEALKHSKDNATLNVMEDKLTFFLPEQFELPSYVGSPVILMNMIMSEQQVAWNSLRSLHHRQGICITSGILAEQKQDYIMMVKEWGWQVDEEQEEQGWLGCRIGT